MKPFTNHTSPYKYILIYSITSFVLFFNLLMLLYPGETLRFAKDGLLLWYNHVLPILLPFMILTNILVVLNFPQLLGYLLYKPVGALFKVNGEAAFIIIMGLFSGYPIGAKLTSDLYLNHSISKSQAQRLLLFTNNCSPLFIIGTLSTCILGNKKLSAIIALSHYMAALAVGIISARFAKSEPINRPFIGTGSIYKIPSAVANGASAIISVGCYIMLFSVILGLLNTTGLLSLLSAPLLLLGFDSSAANGIIGGLFEMTNGCNLASRSALAIPICTAVISFGGFSIHAQSLPYIAAAALKPMPYIISKLIQAILSATICFLLLKANNI